MISRTLPTHLIVWLATLFVIVFVQQNAWAQREDGGPDDELAITGLSAPLEARVAAITTIGQLTGLRVRVILMASLVHPHPRIREVALAQLAQQDVP